MAGVTFDFTEAKVLVTGGSNGIGLGVATAFADAGASVTITGTRAAVADYDHDLSRFAYRQCVMTEPDQIEALAAATEAVDVLVNNAGQVLPGGRNEYDPDVFEQALAINVSSAFRLTRRLWAQLKTSRGAVVNMGSMASFFGIEFVPGYGAAKAAVVQMTKTLAVAGGHDGIRVNAVAPGLIESNMTAPMLPHESMIKPHVDRTPLGRVGTPADIAPAVLFLASPAAGYLTGHTLVVDGGFSIKG